MRDLQDEIGDVMTMIEIMKMSGLVTDEQIADRMEIKKEKINEMEYVEPVKIDFDVDIHMANRDDFLKLVSVTPASIEKDGKFTKHNTGVYFQNIPKFPLEGYSTIDPNKQRKKVGLKLTF